MNVKLIVVSVVIIGVLVGGLSYYQLSHVTPSLIVLSQQDISTVMPGWKVAGVLVANYTPFFSSLYPNATQVAQEEFIKGNATLYLYVIEYNATPTNKPGYSEYGHFLIHANVTGNTSYVNLNNVISEEINAIKTGSGLKPEISNFMLSSNDNVNVLEYGNLTSKDINLYIEVVKDNQSITYISIENASNYSEIYSSIYSSVKQYAVNGTLNGYNYFNLTITSLQGQSFYIVGEKPTWVVILEFYGPPQFQLFSTIMERI
ncbi:hypothetical protein HS7_10280 [Sulfolobales archaeon HS-7]|nr:hypothetical protein HS7_10280 [Sulfolobales archaeon HS-7]